MPYLAMAGVGPTEAIILAVVIGIFAFKILGLLRLKRRLFGGDEPK